MNSRSFRNEHLPDEGGGGGRLVGNLPLSRQTSIYSLTFDELQSTMGGVGKDFGSMNMDELLKNIWSAEENQNQQTIGPLSGGQPGGGGVSGGHLQRQGSLTLPRTLSQKTVDEVWKNISGEDLGGKGVAALDLQQQRQPTLGEMTLEEFLVRAGVVREDMNMLGMNLPGRPNNNMNPLGDGFQPVDGCSGLMGSVNPPDSNQFSMQSPNLPLNVNGVRHQQQQQLFPQQRTTAYTSSVALPASAQLGSPAINAGLVGLADPTINPNLVQGMGFQGGGMGMVNFGAGAAATMAVGSPVNQLSSDGMGKCNGDTSSVSVSPVPLALNGGLRGSGRKRSGAVEKVVERRQRRMIKNRESAARSRARKQAYTVELEAEVAKLKEENEELRKKQAELMEMQKNQVMAIMNNEQGSKSRRLRRTQTGPW